MKKQEVFAADVTVTGVADPLRDFKGIIVNDDVMLIGYLFYLVR